ncbi:MerR family transcriptional regulator [Paenibacillus jiagnxiensis]|uniref:MerR family transcriptional regulator n=1 Tax=Paenibacillus jiagnxiensis TaxID=3228926 RepID=UPI0033B28D8F
MSTIKKTYFKTGEFAKICGVNKKTLFYYDDIGLFQPSITDEKGYRYYSYHQIKVFYTIASLKELNMPLKEIKAYLDIRTPELIVNLSKQKIIEVDKEIEQLNYIKQILEEYINLTNQGMQADIDRIILEEQEEETIICSGLFTEDSSNDYWKWLWAFYNFEANMSSQGTSFAGIMQAKEKILSGNYNDSSYFFVKITNKQDRPNIRIKPKGLYAVGYHRGGYGSMGEAYERMLAFLERNHLQMGSFAYEEYLIGEDTARSKEDYVTKITMEVEM